MNKYLLSESDMRQNAQFVLEWVCSLRFSGFYN